MLSSLFMAAFAAQVADDGFSKLQIFLQQLIDWGVSAGGRIIGAVIIFVVGRFLISFLRKMLARLLAKRHVDASIQSFVKSLVNILLTILLIIAGGIAAYKSLDLIRRLRERGYRVRPVLTDGGSQFVTPLTVSALAESPVYQDIFSLTAENEMGHIRLAREATLLQST